MSRFQFNQDHEPSDTGGPWQSIGSIDQLQRRGEVIDEISISSRELRLSHGRYYINVYLVDDKGNHRIYHSPPIFVDMTPPPVETVAFPRVVPDKTRVTCVPNCRTPNALHFFTSVPYVAPQWNEGLLFMDPESGPCEAWWELQKINQLGMAVSFMGPFHTMRSMATAQVVSSK